jgi:hypothetical protein
MASKTKSSSTKSTSSSSRKAGGATRRETANSSAKRPVERGDFHTGYRSRPDSFSRKAGNSALYGHFVTVTGGDHKGAYGTYEDTSSVDSEGFPVDITVRRRDDSHELIEVKYDDCEAATAGGRR